MAESWLEMWTLLVKQRENWPAVALLIGITATVATYYLNYVVAKPLLITGSRSYADFLQRRCPVLVQQYYPTVWCFTSRLHTIVCAAVGTFTRLPPYRKDILVPPDGGEIYLQWLDNHGNGHHDDRTRPIVVILPGLSGSSSSSYAIKLSKGAVKHGYRSVVFNNRGTNGVKIKSSRMYCAADTEDIHFVVSYIRKKYPDAPLMAVGCSMGGMILFNYVARTGEKCPLTAAMVISMPWDGNDSAVSLEQPLNRLIFNKTMVDGLKKDLRFNRELFDNDERVDVDYVLQSSTVRELDDRFTIKMFGFESVNQYYTAASPCHKIHRVKIPLLSLNSVDDVFAPFYNRHVAAIKKNPNIALVLTSHGGHVSFGDWLSPTRDGLFDKLYQQYVDAVFKYGEKELIGTQKE